MLSFARFTIGSLLIGLGLLGACKSSETTPSDWVSLGLNKSARVGADITVRVDTLSDSRCPIGVACIWAGQAFVSARLSTKDTALHVRLFSQSLPGKSQPDSVDIVMSGQAYKVILRDVVPYPDRSNPQQEKQAIIQVTKL